MTQSDKSFDASESKPLSSLEIEAKLLAQEHRLYHVIINFWHRKSFHNSDPRRAAVTSALVWKLISPAGVAIGAAGIVSLVTLGAFLYQNWLLSQQIALQQSQFAAARRTQLIAWLYEVDPTGRPLADRRTRSEAVVEFVALESADQDKVHAQKLVDLSGAHLEQVAIQGWNIANVNFQGAHLQGSAISHSTFFNCSFAEANLTNCGWSGIVIAGDLNGADLTDSMLFGLLLPTDDTGFIDVDDIKVSPDTILPIPLENPSYINASNAAIAMVTRHPSFSEATQFGYRIKRDLLNARQLERLKSVDAGRSRDFIKKHLWTKNWLALHGESSALHLFYNGEIVIDLKGTNRQPEQLNSH